MNAREQFERMRQEWRQSRRLRLGALVVLLIIGAHVVLTLSDRQQAMADDYRRDAALLGRLEEASRESAWPERAEQAEAAAEAMRTSIPQAASAGLAQAELQAWLGGQAAIGQLEQARVRAEATLDVPDRPDLWQVVARVEGGVPAGGLDRFLQSLSSGLPWIQVERLEVTEGRETQLSAIVRGYYRKPDEAPDAAADATAPAAGGTP
ncbi:MAG: hypothetical protein K0M64_07070 [Rhizobium sp.]|nr:hypothetical protein [Rhizobium sp.]